MGFELKKGKNFALCPAGMWVARCYLVVDIGTQTPTFNGKRDRPRQQIMIGFEFPELLHVFDDKKGKEPFVLTKRYSNTLAGDRNNLKKDLNSWRGRPLNDLDINGGKDEATGKDIAKFTFDRLLGAPAMITVVHEAKKSDPATIMAKISSISKIPTHPVGGQRIVCPPAILPPILYSVDSGPNDPKFKLLPEFIQDDCMKCAEWANIPDAHGPGGDEGLPSEGSDQPNPDDPF